MTIEIKFLGADDAGVLLQAASGLFDDPIDPAATAAFLRDPLHHMFVAIEDGFVVGFVSAVHYFHPDKPRPELWINEVSVAPSHQRRGVGKRLMRSMLDAARLLGCSEAWVLTDRSNAAAMQLYSSSGGIKPTDSLMFTFMLDGKSDS